jgi:hypothetical protein
MFAFLEARRRRRLYRAALENAAPKVQRDAPPPRSKVIAFPRPKTYMVEDLTGLVEALRRAGDVFPDPDTGGGRWLQGAQATEAERRGGFRMSCCPGNLEVPSRRAPRARLMVLDNFVVIDRQGPPRRPCILSLFDPATGTVQSWTVG